MAAEARECAAAHLNKSPHGSAPAARAESQEMVSFCTCPRKVMVRCPRASGSLLLLELMPGKEWRFRLRGSRKAGSESAESGPAR